MFADADRWTYRSVSWNYVRLYTYPLIFVGQSATIGLTILIAAHRYVETLKSRRLPGLETNTLLSISVSVTTR